VHGRSFNGVNLPNILAVLSGMGKMEEKWRENGVMEGEFLPEDLFLGIYWRMRWVWSLQIDI